MSTITEIDKAGRIVVPKKMRDSLHLVPGTRLSIRTEGDSVVIEPERKPRGLYMKKGTLVYDSGSGPGTDAAEEVTNARNARLDSLLSDLSK
ncbi:MAG TPA: AbrB/MazE/SpoVT family DNA-binding domain-containing protein [Acidobacteriaceae bacterium]|nr:AbrB/MazE/SpoVT family DNA-binding domain-containing protein [Acidobacteriaceae bacterium]